MAPANLQGLNIIHPIQHHPVDAHDLLAGQSYPDLSAQLDLWTNLAFECDEPSLPNTQDDIKNSAKNEEEEEDALTSHGTSSGEAAIHDGHVNVVTGTNIGSNLVPAHHGATLPPQPPHFDINAFLSSFSIDPFSTSPVPIHPGITPSLAQLIALHNANPQPGILPPLQHPVAAPPSSLNATTSSASTSSNSNPSPQRSTDDSPIASPVMKRARTRKSSADNTTTPGSSSSTAGGDSPLDDSTAAQVVSAAEDKRRRNTAASARFRLKKKEREAALEGKAKELEHRVSELERECEGLRRENGWLKGLVVGVTGVAQQQATPPPSLPVGSVTATTSGLKRGRDEV